MEKKQNFKKKKDTQQNWKTLERMMTCGFTL